MLNVLLKLKNKKGFTMIEMIIVIVIIAILAAVAVPTMMGYVQKARDSQYVTNARSGLTAASTMMTEAIATGTITATDPASPTSIEANTFFLNNNAKLLELAKVTGTFGNFQMVNGTVVGLDYTEDGRKVQIRPGSAEVTAD